MPKINLCFVWHMHQPFYKDLVSGEYKMPWTRLHALKDYYGMVKILENFPAIHQTFNLVPSLLVQIEEYASGKARDPFLAVALKPAELLSAAEREFLLQHSFQANEQHVINRYPRYAELLQTVRQTGTGMQSAVSQFTFEMLRDLQVLSQLAWFDEEYLKGDHQIAALVDKGRDYSLDDQHLIGEKQREALRNVLSVYRRFAESGQIELSTTPFYHPIVPLVCDSAIASASAPSVLPSHFAYPDDAAEQIRRAQRYFDRNGYVPPIGFWPPEGCVSDQTLSLAARAGFRWIASDDGVLAKMTGPEETKYSPYQAFRWRNAGEEINVLFRDHRLSDLIGFTYPTLSPDLAAEHFLAEVRNSAAATLAEGRDALVTIVLDGENAWESYPENGRLFLRELYTRLAADPQIAALTVSEALSEAATTEIDHIFPGSWIDANFAIWIGAPEDNTAWEYLLQARQLYDRVQRSAKAGKLAPADVQLAYEELLIAEGSDWCWWYGPEHSSANKGAFDQLFRDHLANVYRLLREPVPAELLRPITFSKEQNAHELPSALIQPVIDGSVEPRNEWAGAGVYHAIGQAGAMHSQRSLVKRILYGSDGQNLFLRVDLNELVNDEAPLELQVAIRNQAGEDFRISHLVSPSSLLNSYSDLEEAAFSAAFESVYELRLSMTALRTKRGEPVMLQVSAMRDGMLVVALPAQGQLEIYSSGLAAYAV